MSYFVYALYSEKSDLLYIGQTNDLSRRLTEHINGESRYTSRAADWRLVHSEECDSRSAALTREKQLKSFRGREYLRSIL